MTGPECKELRLRNKWSLQELANRSGINKAYLSEFENGQRRLPDDRLEHLELTLRDEPIGRARPTLADENGHSRLKFLDADGRESYAPPIAHITWTDEGGTTYTMFVGDRSPD